MPEAFYDLDNSPGFLLGRASLLIKTGLRRNFKDLGFELTTEQWAVLCAVCQNEGKTQSFLAEKIFKDKTALTRMLDRLEKSGVLSRRPDQRDRRSYRIYSTSRGRQLHAKLSEIVRDFAARIFAGLAPAELENFKSVLNKITDNVCALSEMQNLDPALEEEN